MIVWSAGIFWSFSEKGCLLLFAPMRDGRVLLRHELTFSGLAPSEFGVLYKSRLKDWGITSVQYVTAQPELFPKPGAIGETLSESLWAAGIPIREGDPNRVAGFARVRAWLQLLPRMDTNRLSPSLVIHPDCTYTIRTLPALVKDTGDPDDVAKCVEEYPARALALWAMSRPAPKQEAPKEKPSPNSWGVQLQLNKVDGPKRVGHDLHERR
jgi:hypothetical protein